MHPSRRGLLMGSAAASVLGLSGCAGLTRRVSATSNGSRDTLTFQTWGADAEVAAYTKLIAQFESTRRGIKVDLQVVPYSEMFTGIDAGLQSGTAPDVFRVGRSLDELDGAKIVTVTAEGKNNGRSKIVGAESNLIRLYARARNGELLGAEGVAVDGEHLAHLLALAIGQQMTAGELATMPFYHPTIEETLQNALSDLADRCGQTN